MAVLPDTLLRHPAIWRADSQHRIRRRRVLSGYGPLDAHLPGGGWPVPALVEVLCERMGLGEVQLFAPALRRLAALASVPACGSAADAGVDPAASRGGSAISTLALAWIDPPTVPYAPALSAWGLDPARQMVVRTRAAAQGLWAMEQALRSGACGAVLGWTEAAGMQALRRLKLAVVEGGGFGVLFRPLGQALRPSPATLRLALCAHEGARHIRLLKVQGGRPAVMPWL